jgi:hypothetical protein
MARYSRRKLYEEACINDYDPVVCQGLAEDEEFHRELERERREEGTS